MKRETITILYGTFVCLMVLALGIAYANVVTELKIEGNAVGQEQQGVYITEVEYLTNNGADTTNSVVNYFLGTMLDSNIVLGSSSSSTITYQVTIKNNTEREQVFIGIIKEETDENAYSNPTIQSNVKTAGGITGLEEYVTTIAPGEYITFPVTYAYAGTDTSNPELQGKINFRFREVPILELSNEGETYTLEKIYAGYTPEEYEFTVSNYNETYTNGVPLTYTFETTITEGSPLEAKIYDENGNEITESEAIGGDKNTQEDHKYTLKLIWDKSKNEEEYQGKEYTCNVKLIATPDDAKYLNYTIEKEFSIDITTNILPTVTAEVSNISATGATITATGSDADNDTLQYTLEINNQTYGPSTTNTWNVTDLSTNVTYSYTVKVTDGYQTAEISGELTTVCSHSYGEWVVTKEATCAATGTRTKTCTICGATESETIAKLTTHTYGSWVVTKEATCTTAGQQQRTCSVCGRVQTKSIPTSSDYCSYTYVSIFICEMVSSNSACYYYCGVCEQWTLSQILKTENAEFGGGYCDWTCGWEGALDYWYDDKGTVHLICFSCNCGKIVDSSFFSEGDGSGIFRCDGSYGCPMCCPDIGYGFFEQFL